MSQKAIAQHPSVAALLQKYPGKSDPKEIIRELARAKVAHAKNNRWSGPPFCAKEFASILGIRCKEVSHDIGGDGRILVQRNGKPLIEFAADRMLERQRFTIFHECAHTLFPDYGEYSLIQHHAPEKPNSDPDKEFEFLCDVAAAEMLFPQEDFERDLLQLPPAGLQSVHTLRVRYEASIDATAYRALSYESRLPLAAVFLTDQKKHFTGEGPLWVNSFSRNTRFKPFIWPGTVPPGDSVVHTCLRSGADSTQWVRETWTVRDEPKTWLVQAARLPQISHAPLYPKVVVLVTLPQ
ncbi:MAG: ImmA/IrrE family metallo-endopeptidase [Verrucomicrobiota bacterium]